MSSPLGRCCVVIPAYNAADTVADLVRRAKAHGLPVFVINDGSTDATAALASKEGAVVISHLRNEGKGMALRTGFEHALREDYEGIVTMDSDGQHDPSEIEWLIREGMRQHAGIAVGNRMGDGVAMPAARRWTNRLMSALVSAVAHQRIPDTQCGFRFIRREVLTDLPLHAARFDIETELLLGAARRRWKIISVPVRAIYTARRSHIRPLADGARFLGLLAQFLLGRR